MNLDLMIPLDMKPTSILELGLGPVPIEEGVYYFPKKTNQVAISSFIVSGGYVYFFQFTIGEEQEIKPGLKAFLKTFPGIPAEVNWCFVFVIPIDKDVTCSQPKELGTLPLYSAAIDVELYSKSVLCIIFVKFFLPIIPTFRFRSRRYFISC